MTKGERTRERIVEETVSLISRSGFDAVTYDAIGGRVGLTRQLVQKYFPGRDALLLAAFDRVAASLVRVIEERIAAPADARTRLGRYVDAHFEWVEREPEGARTMLAFFALSASSPAARARNSRSTELGRQRIETLLRDIELNGQWTGGRKPSAAARTRAATRIQALVIGQIVLVLTVQGLKLGQLRAEAVSQALRET